MSKQKKDDSAAIAAATSPQSQAARFFKDREKQHYNNEPVVYYRTPSSSLYLNRVLGGGLSPGPVRFCGITTGGKSSCALDFMHHFLKGKKKRRAVYFKAEGRLSPDIQARSGSKFCYDPEEWRDGECLVSESNIFEFVYDLIKNLVNDNPEGYEYFFIIDSVDSLIREADHAKPLSEHQGVAAGPRFTAVFLQQLGLPLSKRGHVAIFISQKRDNIPAPYTQTPVRQGGASGGHAIEHSANVVIEFLNNQTENSLIREGFVDDDGDGGDKEGEGGAKKKKAPIIGHWCRVKFIKTDNEENGKEGRYPIRHKMTGAKSVWRELEVSRELVDGKVMTKAGSWLSFDPATLQKLRVVDPECPEKIQGQAALRVLLDERPVLCDYIHDLFDVTSDIHDETKTA